MKIKDIPIHKKICNTNFIVDYYEKYVEDTSATFLTHFHADHYKGMKKSYNYKIYSSLTTTNLIKKCYNISDEYLYPMDMYKIYDIDKHKVVCIDANHCPGAVCFVFIINDIFYLHTGDFRFNKKYHLEYFQSSAFFDLVPKHVYKQNNFQFDAIFLDNTYEGEKNFESQENIIFRTINILRKFLYPKMGLAEPNVKLVFPTYKMGKEKLILCIAHIFNFNINVEDKKFSILQCYSEYTKNRLNEFVIDVTQKYKKIYGPINKFSYFLRKEKLIDKLKIDNMKNKVCNINLMKLTVSNKTDNILETKGLVPFARFVCNDKNAKIDMISSQQVRRNKINEKYKNFRYQNIFIVYGSGWNDKIEFWNYKRSDKTIRNGIHLIKVPYSEHTSSSELEEFKETYNSTKLIRTVMKSSRIIDV